MINSKAIKSLFKPHLIQNKAFNELLIDLGIPLKKLVKLDVECECSKSIDESCINIECQHNLFGMHKDELYIEVLKEIQAERKAIKERDERNRKKYGYI